MQKALGELFILKSTKPLPIIFKSYTLSQKRTTLKRYSY